MRDYAKLAPTFWTGETGKALRRRGSEAVVMALYLVSSPHSNMLGLYYQPLMYAAHETGLGIEGASKGLRECVDCGFCSYDADTEMVFVHEMAAWQISDSLSSADKRCKGIQKDYDALPANPFLGAFFERYSEPFHLKRCRLIKVEKPEVDQAPSKPHRSQEQEQEQEQELVAPPEAPSKTSANLTVSDLVAEGVESKIAADWLKVRKAKKAPLTQTAWDGVKREAEIAGMTPAQAVKHATENSWQGFKAAWLQPKAPNGQRVIDPFEVAH